MIVAHVVPERCLEPDEKPVDVMAGWDKEKDKKKSAEENMFVFKKKIFLKDDDREMEDPAAKDLIYKQAQASVISSEYPCTVDDAIRLASLQFQIVYGDHNAQFHVPKFLMYVQSGGAEGGNRRVKGEEEEE